MTSALAISRRLSWCYDDVIQEDVDEQMLSLGSKAYDKSTLQCVAHYTLSHFTFTHLYHRILGVSFCVVVFDDNRNEGRIRRRQLLHGGGQAYCEAESLLSCYAHAIM